ncbi:BQ2448_52 [Microbotryum intermedium]|uniref:BQ2448_52 protein n=1 Tax=Microbotryum intermedium TaxID=269621 RepID=A0A238F776_9BASI|nr:BQ2448_52 [Microbotryum intermedium]
MSTSNYDDEAEADSPPVNNVLTKYRSTSLTKEYASVHSYLASTCTPGGLLRLLATPTGLTLIVASRDGPNGVGELWFNIEQTNLIRLGLRRALIEGGVASGEARAIEGDHWEDKGAEAAYQGDTLTLVPYSTFDTPSSSSASASNSASEEGQLGTMPLQAQPGASGGFGQAVFTSQAALDRALKAIKKQLDRVGSNKALDGFSKMRDAWATVKKHRGRVVALDVETPQWTLGQGSTRGKILDLLTGKHPDLTMILPPYKYFSFGDSQIVPQSSLTIILQRLLHPSPPPPYPILLILHAPGADLFALALLGVDVPLFRTTLEPLLRPRLSSTPGTFILDTQALYRGWSKVNSQPTMQNVGREPKLISLGDAVQRVGLAPGEDLHNAGNDAYYTWKVFECMMNKDDVVRTPSGAGAGVGTGTGDGAGTGRVWAIGQGTNGNVRNGNGKIGAKGKATPTSPPPQHTRRIPGYDPPPAQAPFRTASNDGGWGARPVQQQPQPRGTSGGWNVPDGSQNRGQGW